MNNAVPVVELNNNSIVYDISFSPHTPFCLATVSGLLGIQGNKIKVEVFSPLNISGDGSLRVWDTKNPAIPSQIIQAHGDEALSCSWNYFKQVLIKFNS